MSQDLASAGLPISFASTKTKTEKNRKKREQKKKNRRGGRNKLKSKNNNASTETGCVHFNYAEEFKLNEVLNEYRDQFTILMAKDDRLKSADEEYEEEEYEYEETADINNSYEYDEQEEYGQEEEQAPSNEDVEDVQEQLQEQEEQAPPVSAVASSNTSSLHKYYQQRYDYFHKFDEGIQIDDEGWYSVTPEVIAEHIAKEAFSIASTFVSEKGSSSELVVLDAFCGVGGNTIQFAKYFDKVIAVDLNAERLEMARHNATVYGVADKIEFIHGDVFKVLPALSSKVNFVFMSPPWGGPDYVSQTLFCPDRDILEGRGAELFHLARSICKNVIIFLPRQTNIYSIAMTLRNEISKDNNSEDDDNDDGESFVVEQHWLRNRLKAISVYFFP